MNPVMNIFLMLGITITLYLVEGLTMWTVKGILLALILLTASTQDATSHEADDFLSVMLLILAFVDFSVDKVLSMLLGAVCIFMPLYLITRFSKSGFGGADIKITTAAALSLGAFGSVIGLLVGMTLAVIVQTIRNKLKKSENGKAFALLPYLSVGLMIGYIL